MDKYGKILVMNQKEIEDNSKNETYWEFGEIKNVGFIEFLKLEHRSNKGVEVLSINISQIQGVRKTFNEKMEGIIEIIIDEKLLPIINNSVRIAHTYNHFNKILKLIFYADTRIGELLERHFLNET